MCPIANSPSGYLVTVRFLADLQKHLRDGVLAGNAAASIPCLGEKRSEIWHRGVNFVLHTHLLDPLHRVA